MAGRLEVVFGELSRSAAAVRSAAAGIGETSTEIKPLRGQGQATGDDACANAFDAMAGLWVDQLTLLAENASDLADRTRAARDAYRTTETARADGFRGGR